MYDREPRPEQHDALRRARHTLDDAITSPSGDAVIWANGVLRAVRKLGRVYQKHVSEAEGPEGGLTEVLSLKPHMQRRVTQIKREHETLRAEIAQISEALTAQIAAELVDKGALRQRATQLDDALRLHQSKGVDLLYEAYHRVDGGPG